MMGISPVLSITNRLNSTNVLRPLSKASRTQNGLWAHSEQQVNHVTFTLGDTLAGLWPLLSLAIPPFFSPLAQAAVTVVPSPMEVVNSTTGGLLVLATTTLVRFYSNRTAAVRGEALEELYNKVEKRHQRFVDKILPRLEEANRMEASFAAAVAASRNLDV